MRRAVVIQTSVLGTDPKSAFVVFVSGGYITVRDGETVAWIRTIYIRFLRIQVIADKSVRRTQP